MSEVVALLRLDTEDYITPASVDAALALAEMLAARGWRATFPLVGEKARLLAGTGRRDVLRALARHDVGYHSDTHSRHPTIAEELRECSWVEGVERFRSRERQGLLAVAEATGQQPACYTQPGGNWVPHAYPFLREAGIPLHYSEGWNCYLEMGDRPYYYQGVLSWSAPVAALKPLLNRLPAEEGEFRRLLEETWRRLAEAGGGLLNIVAHPNELVTRQSWDVLNFGAGANHPLRLPEVRPAAECAAALASFRRCLEHLAALPGVRLAGANELSNLYSRLPDRLPDRAELLRWARQADATGSVGWLERPEKVRAWPAADILRGMMGLAGGAGVERPLLAGPEEEGPRPLQDSRGVPAQALRQGARQAALDMEQGGAVPAAVMVAGAAVRPEEFLLALARLAAQGEMAAVPLGPARFLPAERVKPEEALHWDWPVFQPGFQAPSLRQAAVRQAWTLVPACRRG